MRTGLLVGLALVAVVLGGAFAGVLGFVVLGNLTSAPLLSQTRPEMQTPTTPLEHLLVVDGSSYTGALILTLQSIQAVVNTVRPNNTGLYIIFDPQDQFWLQQVYVQREGIHITYFPTSNDPVEDLATLVDLFRPFFQGLVLFRAEDRLFYPAVINFAAAYGPALVVPVEHYGRLIHDPEFWQLKNFASTANQSTIEGIRRVYDQQVMTLGDKLSGLAVWDLSQDLHNLDFILAQHYWVWPAQFLTNSSFAGQQEFARREASTAANKPLVGSWPANLSRLPVPSFPDLGSIPNLSVHQSPWGAEERFNSSTGLPPLTIPPFQGTFPDLDDHPAATIYYAVVVTFESFEQPWYATLPELLQNNPNLFTGVSLGVQDSLLPLFPALLQWYTEENIVGSLTPQLRWVGNVFEPLYYPSLVSSRSVWVGGLPTDSDTSALDSLERWDSTSYREFLPPSLGSFWVPTGLSGRSSFFGRPLLTHQFDVELWEEANGSYIELANLVESNYLLGPNSSRYLLIEVPYDPQTLLGYLTLLNSVLDYLGGFKSWPTHRVSPDALAELMTQEGSM